MLLSHPKLYFWRGFIFIGVYVSVCWSIISKSYKPILIKSARVMYNDNNSVAFEYETNRFIRIEVTDNLLF